CALCGRSDAKVDERSWRSSRWNACRRRLGTSSSRKGRSCCGSCTRTVATSSSESADDLSNDRTRQSRDTHVGEGNLVYCETCGNPDGKPALVVHGGPGSGCTPWHRRMFDPAAYRVVLFDQRGCGRSSPHASEPDIDLSTNTTQHLVADIELLRRDQNVDRWLLLGGSWGCTLSLAYAEAHPDRVSEIVLWGVTTGRRAEADWWFRGGVAPLFPEQWAALRAGLPAGERDGDI